MEIEQAAKALKELGHPTRLNLFKVLVKASYEGLPVGDIQEKLSIPNSTLSHYISVCCLGDNASCKQNDETNHVKVGGCASTPLNRTTS